MADGPSLLPAPEAVVTQSSVELEMPSGPAAPTRLENWTGLKKGPLRFVIKAKAGRDPAIEALLEHLRVVGEASLYRWANFPIELPPLLRTLPKIDFSEALFKTPRFDELEEVAFSFTSNQKRLNEQQLSEIRQWGEFEVDSINFPGQKHRWKLSWLLQKGTERDRKNLRRALAFSLRFIVIYAANRWNAKFFSLGHTVRGVRKGFLMLADLFVGLPHTLPDRLPERLTWARIEHLINELTLCNDDDEATIDEFVKLFLDRLAWEYKSEVPPKKLSRGAVVEFRVTDEAGLVVNLSRARSALAFVDELAPLLRGAIEAENTIDWFTEYRDEAIKRATMSDGASVETMQKDLLKNVQHDVDEECLRKVFANVRTSTAIAHVASPRVVELLIEAARLNRIVDRVGDEFASMLVTHTENVERELKVAFPIRSKIKTWKKRRMNDARVEFETKHRWFKYEETLKRAREEGLMQSSYFLARDFMFVRDREERLVEEFEKIRKPAREFRFKTKIWRPANWRVFRVSDERQGVRAERVRVPTELSERLCERETHERTKIERERGFHYEFEKSTVRTVTTETCGWRWANFAHRVWKWTSNAIFYCLLVIPWCSPLGIRGLVSPTPFYPGYIVSQVDGTLCHDPASRQHSFVSRLRALWRHVHKSRVKFEAAPDRGFVGKNVVRWLNKFWNYVLKGAFGTVLLCVVQPALCIVVTLASIIAGVTAPLWAPLVVTAYHLFFIIFIFDADNAYKHIRLMRRNRFFPLAEAILYRFVFVGLLQPLLIVVFVGVVCPFIALVVAIFGYVRFGVRSAWDAIMFALIVKPRGRVPAMNSFVARRVAGPGLSADYFFQIEPAQALALLELHLQSEELKHFEEQVKHFIGKPMRHFAKYVQEVFGPFGARVDSASDVYTELETQANELRSVLAEKVNERRRELRCELAYGTKSKIKLERSELAKVLKLGAEMVSDFYPTHIVPRLLDGGRHADEAHFWHAKNLSVGDWRGLTAQLFAEIFSDEFLLPLEEADSRFRLDVEHVDAKDYLDALVSGKHRDDLDAATESLRAPSQKFSTIQRPMFNAELFVPLSVVAGQLTAFKIVDERRDGMAEAERAFSAECAGLIPQPSLVMAKCYNRRAGRDQGEMIELADVAVRNLLRDALRKVEPAALRSKQVELDEIKVVA